MRFRLLLWSLRRRPWRNLLISLSVGITVAVLIVFFSARSEIQKYLSNAEDSPYQRLWVKPRNLSKGMQYPLALKEQLGRVPGVQQIMYSLWTGTKVDETAIAIQACSEELPTVESDIVLADADTVKKWKADRTAAIVTDRAAALLRVGVGEQGEVKLPTGSLKFRVVGIVDGSKFPYKMVMHYDYVDEVLGRKSMVSDFRVVLDRKTNDRPVIEAVNQLLTSYSSQLVTEKTMLQLRGVNRAQLIPSLLGALGIVLLVTTALGIANSTIISVRERTAELATLRVLGFRKSVLWQSIINQSLLVCLIGGAAGAVVAWIVMRDGISLGPVLQSIKVTNTGLIAGLAVSLMVPLVGSSFAAWLAVRQPLSEALRSV